jgi:hypothetical protein
MSDILTEPEQDLLRRLSSAPECMHPPDQITENEKLWECGKCGRFAPKIIHPPQWADNILIFHGSIKS